MGFILCGLGSRNDCIKQILPQIRVVLEVKSIIKTDFQSNSVFLLFIRVVFLNFPKLLRLPVTSAQI